jgi:glycosidase
VTYKSWWGIETLPCVNETDEGFKNYIIDDDDSVVAHWLGLGADGFRLDVADELPDEFISALRARIKGIKPDALLVGEVWEDASNKISYGERRRYFVGGELDSVMNYPFRNCIINYVKKNDGGALFKETVMSIAENYPRCVLDTLMNMLSTHDTERILSELSPAPAPSDKDSCAGYKMSDEAREIALIRMKAATFLQFTLPGMPCIYYGDEIGMEGLGDPFSRGYFEWERVEENALRSFFIGMAELRNESEALKYGDVSVESDGDGRVIIERRYRDEVYRACVNTGAREAIEIKGEILLSERVQIEDNLAFLDEYGFLLERLGRE